MLIVDTKAPEPAWLPVMGAEALFAPIDRSMLRRARRAALKAIGGEQNDSQADAAEQLEELGDALSEALIVAGVRDWRGVVTIVVDDAGQPVLGGDGKPQVAELPFSPARLAASLADPITFEAFDEAYVRPFAARERARAAPGNAFAASPSTTGASETQEPITAGSPAPASAADASSAHTGSMSRRRKPKRSSGTS